MEGVEEGVACSQRKEDDGGQQRRRGVSLLRRGRGRRRRRRRRRRRCRRAEQIDDAAVAREEKDGFSLLVGTAGVAPPLSRKVLDGVGAFGKGDTVGSRVLAIATTIARRQAQDAEEEGLQDGLVKLGSQSCPGTFRDEDVQACLGSDVEEAGQIVEDVVLHLGGQAWGQEG